MATSVEVLNYLIPNGGWIQVGDDFEGIQFIECEAITKKQFTDAFAIVDNLKAQTSAAKTADKAALLVKLGITEDEAKLLLA